MSRTERTVCVVGIALCLSFFAEAVLLWATADPGVEWVWHDGSLCASYPERHDSLMAAWGL